MNSTTSSAATTSTSISAQTAFVANWVCTALTLTILLSRLATIQYQLGRPDTSTWVIAFALLVFITRVICNYYILKYGTVSGLKEEDGAITHAELHHAQTGSMLTLTARVLITTFYWLMCALLLLVYRRILSEIRWVRVAIKVTWAVMAITYLAVILTTFLECRPLHLFWQLHPDPGHCVKAYAQLLVQCISNITIDLFLMIISIPILRAQARTFPHNLQLGSIFILGTFCIIVTCVRIYYTYLDASAQSARSFWASIQALVAAFVANAPSIYGATIVQRRKVTSSALSRSGTRDSTMLAEEEKARPSHEVHEIQRHTPYGVPVAEKEIGGAF